MLFFIYHEYRDWMSLDIQQKKRFIRQFFFRNILTKKTHTHNSFSFYNDYYANEYCIDVLSFRLSIYIVNANDFSQENFLGVNKNISLK